jgi:hypothetical protein
MNKEEIIKLAQEAGLIRAGENYTEPARWGISEITDFYSRVAAAEREACAKVCEGLGVHPALNVFNGGPEWYKHGKDCAAAIRART